MQMMTFNGMEKLALNLFLYVSLFHFSEIFPTQGDTEMDRSGRSTWRPLPKKGRWKYFVLWDYSKKGGRFFECNIHYQSYQSYKVFAHDGDEDYFHPARIFQLGIQPKSGDR